MRNIIQANDGYYHVGIYTDDKGYFLRKTPIVAWDIAQIVPEDGFGNDFYVIGITTDGAPDERRPPNRIASAIVSPDGRVLENGAAPVDDENTWFTRKTQEHAEKQKG